MDFIQLAGDHAHVHAVKIAGILRPDAADGLMAVKAAHQKQLARVALPDHKRLQQPIAPDVFGVVGHFGFVQRPVVRHGRVQMHGIKGNIFKSFGSQHRCSPDMGL